MPSTILAKFSPARTLLSSIIILIAIGTALLALPGTSYIPLTMVDLIFTTTSAITATGLFPIKFTQFTPFGHAIILLLIQIGSLGIITLGVFLYRFLLILALLTYSWLDN